VVDNIHFTSDKALVERSSSAQMSFIPGKDTTFVNTSSNNLFRLKNSAKHTAGRFHSDAGRTGIAAAARRLRIGNRGDEKTPQPSGCGAHERTNWAGSS